MQKIIKKFGLVLLLTSLSISVSPSLSFATNYVCECKKYNDHLYVRKDFQVTTNEKSNGCGDKKWGVKLEYESGFMSISDIEETSVIPLDVSEETSKFVKAEEIKDPTDEGYYRVNFNIKSKTLRVQHRLHMDIEKPDYLWDHKIFSTFSCKKIR